jgi:hypothetical protein
MNSPALGLRVASVLAGLISLAHLVRLLLGSPIILGSQPVPLWLSGAAFVVAGLLSCWFCKLSRSAGPAALPAA